MSDTTGRQVFMLQLVDAEDGSVCRFSAGGKVEIDLVNQCVKEIQSSWMPPDHHFREAMGERLPSFLGLTTRKHAINAAADQLAEWRVKNDSATDWSLSAAISRVILALKLEMVTMMRGRLGSL